MLYNLNVGSLGMRTSPWLTVAPCAGCRCLYAGEAQQQHGEGPQRLCHGDQY